MASPSRSPLSPRTTDLSGLLLMPLPNIAPLPGISPAPAATLPAAVPIQPLVQQATPQQIAIAQLAAFPTTTTPSVPTIPTTMTFDMPQVVMSPPLSPQGLRSPPYITSPVVASPPLSPQGLVSPPYIMPQVMTPPLLPPQGLRSPQYLRSPISPPVGQLASPEGAIGRVGSPPTTVPTAVQEDFYPDTQLPRLNKNQQALVDMMKTIYSDRTVLRDVILKHKDKFDRLIQMSQEYGLKYVPLDFAKIFGEPYLLDSPEKVTPDYINALLEIIGYIIYYERRVDDTPIKPPEPIFKGRGFSNLPIDKPFNHQLDTAQWARSADLRAGRYRDTNSPSYKSAVDVVVDLWNNIARDMAELGHEFHYFEFFRSDHPRVRSFWDRIPLTPRNFEAATMLITP